MFYDCLNTAADSMFVKESALRSILSLALRSHDQIPAFTMASIPAVLYDGISTLKMKKIHQEMYIITTGNLLPPLAVLHDGISTRCPSR